MDIIILPYREGSNAAAGHGHPKLAATSAEVPLNPAGCLAVSRLDCTKQDVQVCLKGIPCSVWVKALS